MEAVIFDGKEYIKASVLAEKFRYTSDYLGQLCRAKKVDARLVGRAWYINLDSLNHHKDSRYKTTTPKTPEPIANATLEKPKNNYLSRIDVEPVLKNKTVKIFRENAGALSEFSVKYEQDEHSLIPRVNKGAVSASIPVIPADAERLKVPKGLKEFRITDFKVEPLPEVFLSGKLHVDGIPEAFEEEPLSDSPADIANKIKLEQPVSTISPKRLVSVRPRNLMRQNVQNDIKRVPEMVQNTRTETNQKTPEFVEPVRILSHQNSSRKLELMKNSPSQEKGLHASKFQKPDIARNVAIKEEIHKKAAAPVVVGTFSPEIVKNKKTASDTARTSFLLPLVSFFAATLIALLLIATESEVTIGGGLYADRLIVEKAHVATFLNTLFP